MAMVNDEEEQPSLPWNEAMTVYIRHAGEEEGPYEIGHNSLKTYLKILRIFRQHCQMYDNIGQVRTEDIRTFLQGLLRGQRKHRYVHLVYAALVNAFKIWYALGHLRWNPTIGALPPMPRGLARRRRVTAHKTQPFEAQEVYDLLRTVEQAHGPWDGFLKDRDWLLFALTYVTGLRNFEVLQIKVEDINFERREVRCIRKGEEEKEAIVTDLLTYLYQQVNDQNVPDIMQKIRDYIELKHLLPEHKLFYMVERNFELRIKYWARKAGITNIEGTFPHRLRHTYGSHLSWKNVSAFTIRDLMNHKHVGTTDQYVSPGRNENLANVLRDVGLFLDERPHPTGDAPPHVP